jgi:uncharacterized protein (DUF885 family)
MIGCREILRLREQSNSAQGSRFVLSDFHQTVLGSGAVPLIVLATNVERWNTGVLTRT